MALIRKDSIPISNHGLRQELGQRHQHGPQHHKPQRDAHPHGRREGGAEDRHEGAEHVGGLEQRLELGDVQARADARGRRGILAGGQHAAVGVEGALGEAEDEGRGDGGLVEGEEDGGDGVGCLEG